MKKYLYVVLIASVIVNVVSFAVVLPSLNAFNTESSATSKLRVRVTDALTELPLENATVCVPETESYYNTDKDGYTELITVPVLKNQSLNATVPQAWGEITLLVYKDGYVDFVIFFIMVREDTVRQGPNITLFPTNTPDDQILHTLVESPDNAWAKELRDKYKR